MFSCNQIHVTSCMSQGVPGIPGIRGKVGARGLPVSENKFVKEAVV